MKCCSEVFNSCFKNQNHNLTDYSNEIFLFYNLLLVINSDILINRLPIGSMDVTQIEKTAEYILTYKSLPRKPCVNCVRLGRETNGIPNNQILDTLTRSSGCTTPIRLTSPPARSLMTPSSTQATSLSFYIVLT